MTEKEMFTNLIDSYTMLQRIKAKQPENAINSELDYQIKVAKAKLEALGIDTTDLEL